jgi:hypothetical protein
MTKMQVRDLGTSNAREALFADDARHGGIAATLGKQSTLAKIRGPKPDRQDTATDGGERNTGEAGWQH